MENIYLIILAILFLLAISDLIIGVSNDAINFLNSAIGAKVAPLRVILIIAAFGVLFGATFSGGMMEVARKGIFNPQMFTFHEIMIVFLAVMITDVILLDLFNTLGLPTSTTVSIVFELLGSAVGVAFMKVRAGTGDAVSQFINSESALLIISGILLSIVVAFTIGAIVQYISRIIFSFKYHKPMRYFGSIWGGLAMTSIFYFILIKGSKGAAFMSDDVVSYIQENTLKLLMYSFIISTTLLQLLFWLFKTNILKIVVLAGTFALAMAFAGNDLVNFIGVPLAGFESYKAFMAEPGASAHAFSMEALQGKVQTPTFMLLIAGMIMVITLAFSRKARTVVRTTLNLSRQDEGYERFETSAVARTLVRGSINMGQGISTVIPKRLNRFIQSRFNDEYYSHEKSGVSFDLIRASVNLFVASILISFATTLKLPLSTTYVTFMVAMGTSLADGAWNRESAVYRITGVVTVISGWFLTAFTAFTAAFLVALVIYKGGIVAIFALIIIAVIFVIRTHKIHRTRDENEIKKSAAVEKYSIDYCKNNTISTLLATQKVLSLAFDGLKNAKRKKLKKAQEGLSDINTEMKLHRNHLQQIIRELEFEIHDSAYHYVQVVDYLKESVHNVNFIVNPAFRHTDNNHTPLSSEQVKTLEQLFDSYIQETIESISHILHSKEYDKQIDDLYAKSNKCIDYIQTIRKKQIKKMQKEKSSTKANMLYLDILNECKNYELNVISIVKSYRRLEDGK